MIKLIGRVAAACALACAGLTTLAMSGAPASNTPPFPNYTALGFDACRLPCYAGLHPGQTAFDSAGTLLQANIPQPLSQIAIDAQTLRFQEQAARPRLLGMVSSVNGRVRSVEVQTPLPARWLLDELGSPDCVIPGDPQDVGGMHSMVWLTPVGLIWAAIDATPRLVGSEHEVFLMTLIDMDEKACWGDLLPWRGFAPAWRYRETQ
ncbi:MAG: hypothetical protein IPK19_17865 [Chloroflexi bacterium]|nr:hypothetical protein [Chloroflexota bacterium]